MKIFFQRPDWVGLKPDAEVFKRFQAAMTRFAASGSPQQKVEAQLLASYDPGSCIPSTIEGAIVARGTYYMLTALSAAAVAQAVGVANKLRALVVPGSVDIRELGTLMQEMPSVPPELAQAERHLLTNLASVPEACSVYVYAIADDAIVPGQQRLDLDTELLTAVAARTDAAHKERPQEQVRFACFWCRKCAAHRGTALLECKRCKQVRYCSKACQEADWHGFHNKECRPLAEGLMSPGVLGVDRVATEFRSPQSFSSILPFLGPMLGAFHGHGLRLVGGVSKDGTFIPIPQFAQVYEVPPQELKRILAGYGIPTEEDEEDEEDEEEGEGAGAEGEADETGDAALKEAASAAGKGPAWKAGVDAPAAAGAGAGGAADAAAAAVETKEAAASDAPATAAAVDEKK